jgi:hypothetical protein
MLSLCTRTDVRCAYPFISEDSISISNQCVLPAKADSEALSCLVNGASLGTLTDLSCSILDTHLLEDERSRLSSTRSLSSEPLTWIKAFPQLRNNWFGKLSIQVDSSLPIMWVLLSECLDFGFCARSY